METTESQTKMNMNVNKEAIDRVAGEIAERVIDFCSNHKDFLPGYLLKKIAEEGATADWIIGCRDDLYKDLERSHSGKYSLAEFSIFYIFSLWSVLGMHIGFAHFLIGLDIDFPCPNFV